MAYNSLILDLVDMCKNHTDIQPSANNNKHIWEKCRKLKEEQFIYYPLINENVGDRLYAYKTNQPRMELFDATGYGASNSGRMAIIVVIIILLLLFIQ